MQGFVIFFMISFLEQDISADTCVFQLAVVFHGSGGNVDIDPADSPIFMFDAINGLDRFQYVLNRIPQRIFSCFQCQAFVSHVLQGNYLLTYLFLCQLFACYGLVLQMIRAVDASVHTIIGKI